MFWFQRAPYLEVTKLSELLSTIIKLASKWFDLLMNNLVCADISSLSKCFSTQLALVRPLSSVAALMSLVQIRMCG